MSIIQGTSKAAGGGYTIDQSVRFNDDDSAYLVNSSPSTGDSTKLATFSVWLKKGNLFTQTGRSSKTIFSQGANDGGNNYTVFYHGTTNLDDYFRWGLVEGGSATFDVKWSPQLRDPSAWYHLFTVLDTDQASSTDRIKLWVNGVQITDTVVSSWPTLGETTDLGTTQQMEVGRQNQNAGFMDGYLAEFHYLDGITGDVTDFGEFNNAGVWVPKAYTNAAGYGTNGFYLDFADSGSLGTDVSGNGNDFTSSGLTSDDQVTDTPTDNSCTWNPLDIGGPGGNPTLSDGNLVVTASSSASYQNCRGTFAMTTGKWYWELAYTSGGSKNQRMIIGISDNTTPIYYAYNTRTAHIEGYTGIAYYKNESASIVDSGTYVTFGNGDHIMFAFDADAGKLWFGKNGTWMGSPAGDPAAGTGASLESIPTGERWQPQFTGWYSNQGTFYFLEDTWTYTAPTGFNALSTANLPTPAIADGSAYFQTTLYTGNGTAIGSGGNAVSQIENSTFQPDFVWIKRRNAAVEHVLTDAVRGVTKELSSNDTGAEETVAEGLTTFGSSGFTVGSDGSYNTNTGTYVAWQWLAGNGTVSNTDGSITSTVSVDQTAKFSIATYTGTGTAVATVGHGLGVEPDMIILKFLNTTANWNIYHKELGNTKRLVFTTAASTTSSAYWNNTSPTSSVFTLGSSLNQIYNYVAYCFASVEGFSKFGSYTGNGSSNGSFVWCGFRPAFVMTKRTDSTGNWTMFDNQREGYNVDNDELVANTTAAETTTDYVDILSNGFKLRSSDADVNASNGTYIFMAFAEHPFGGSGVAPVPAR